MARQERSAGFVIFHRGGTAASHVEFLLLDYGRHWDLPKGHVEKGENDLTAAVRELREETGIEDARLIDGFREEIVYFFRHPKRGLIRKTVVFFLAETPHQKITLSREHSGYLFLPFEQARQKITFPTARKLLDAAWKFLQK
jgi:bis(5'-nucleosidyl)-tetraphosphatase